MAGELVALDAGLLNLLHKSFDGNGIALPFVTEIFLLECHVAGTAYRNDIKVIEPEIAVENFLVFKREPDNKHDSLAIRIYDRRGRLLGYVPKEKNEVIARLMDAGKLIFGRLELKEWQGDWLKIGIRVFMRDF